MKTLPLKRRRKSGFASYLLVLSTAAILTALTVSAYKRAQTAHRTQSTVQLQTDYLEKEDAVMRAIVAITPNRAIGAMMNNSAAASNPLRWETIFNEALDQANARTSISTALQASLGVTDLKISNVGDSQLLNSNLMFRAARVSTANPEAGYMTSGTIPETSELAPLAGYPPFLRTDSAAIMGATGDSLYPIISALKLAEGVAAGNDRNFNILTYPNINFGYAKPGQPFVAKRNWWAFSMDMSANDAGQTQLNTRPPREMVLSIYEIPSQLAISASSFMSIGKLASGEVWDKSKVKIAGGVFASRAAVDGKDLEGLSSRRGVTLAAGTSIGETGKTTTNTKPFKMGVREAAQMENLLDENYSFPVSQSSESGRVAFIPINRGGQFFDRHAHAAENNSLSPTTWNNYSIGALQCKMQLDIIEVEAPGSMNPTRLRFSFMRGGVRDSMIIDLVNGAANGLPVGYIFACNEFETYDFGTSVVDVAFGANGQFAYDKDVSGLINFDDDRFGTASITGSKTGYYRPSYPFEKKVLTSGTANGKICIAVYPMRLNSFLAAIGADSTDVNNSLVVNVDYTAATGSVHLREPNVPCTNNELDDYGLILEECRNLTDFPNGFSLVSNLRTFIGDDFNLVEYSAAPPEGYTPPPIGYFPACSLFVPDKRYGVVSNASSVTLQGQIGSLSSDTSAQPVRPLDSKNLDGKAFNAASINVNLNAISHPLALPPITMMNWLVVLEERRRDFIEN